MYDLAWSPNGTRLISGSVDNSVIIWDTSKGMCVSCILTQRSNIAPLCLTIENEKNGLALHSVTGFFYALTRSSHLIIAIINLVFPFFLIPLFTFFSLYEK